MKTIQEIEAALERLPPAQLREVGEWIAARLMPEITPAMLAALDEGIHSLKTETTVPAEEVRKKSKNGLPCSLRDMGQPRESTGIWF